MHKESDINKNETSLSVIPASSCPPAIGIIFPVPVMVAMITAVIFAKVPKSDRELLLPAF